MGFNIGFDAKKIVNNFTGIGNYSRTLVHALAKDYPQNHYFLYAPKKVKHKEVIEAVDMPSITMRYPSDSYLIKEWWRCRGLSNSVESDGLDLFHGLSNELPWGLPDSCRKVVTIHDLIFLRLPETYGWLDRKILEMKTRHACRVADTIVAISERTKLDIMEFYGVPAERITVLYQGCNDCFSRVTSLKERDEVRAKYGLPERYILSVGTIEPRKNHITLVKAFLEMPESDVHLVLISRHTKQQDVIMELVNKSDRANRVHIINGVPLEHLPALYQACTVFCYPSLYEGFGIPVLEALMSRVPVVAATGSCLEEAGGPDSLYCNPLNPDEFASALSSVIGDEALAHTMTERGYEYAQRFSNHTIAQQMMDVYHATLNR